MAVSGAASPTDIAEDLTKDATATTPEDIEAQLTQLRQDISQLAEMIGTFGVERVDSYRRKATAMAGDAKHAAKTQISDMEEDLSRRIRQNPLQSVAIAAGVGFVAALLTRR